MHRIVQMTLCLLLLSMAWACGPNSTVTVPDGYVALDEDDLGDDIAQKLISADGAMVIVRERENDPYGTLEFWSEALEREITEGRGYELVTKESLSAGGVPGQVLEFKGAYQEKIYLYHVALFATEDSIVTVETVALEEQQERHKETLAKTIRSLKIDE